MYRTVSACSRIRARNRWEAAARFQNPLSSGHTIKYGFEFYRNAYDINQTSTGPSGVFANPLAVGTANGSNPDNHTVSGYRVTNNWTVCTTRGTIIVCPPTNANGASVGQGILSGLGVPAGRYYRCSDRRDHHR